METEFEFIDPVDCDRGRLAQLFSNLLGNALTYGAADQPIRVRVRNEGDHFELSVVNAGAAIPAIDLERLFQPFFRGAARASRQGLGLGLYIAHQIATAHDGTLEVASTEIETRFTFRMPLVQLGPVQPFNAECPGTWFLRMRHRQTTRRQWSFA